MATGPEAEVIVRALILRHAQRRLNAMCRRTPQYATQLTMVKDMERHLDAALDKLAPDQIVGEGAEP